MSLLKRERRDLIDILSDIPGIHKKETRDALLAGLPITLRESLEPRPVTTKPDLIHIVAEMERRPQLRDGTWPIDILIANAIQLAKGMKMEDELQMFLHRQQAGVQTADADSVDFAIITALEVEHQAIIDRLDHYKRVRDEKVDIWTYCLGRASIANSDEAYRVVVVLLPVTGPELAAVATSDIMRRWNPRNVLMVGIAGGVRQDVKRKWRDDDLELGDVVVAESIEGYEYTKEFDEIQQSRARGYRTSCLLLERARHVQDAQWTEQIQVPRPKDARRPKPKRFIGPIASGNKVIASKEFIDKLVARWPQLLAVEMEGVGVATAAFYRPQVVNCLVVRGLSDWADPDKNEDQGKGWREYAANSAAAYVMAFLRSGPVKPRGGDDPS
jgi:nucleoside phosphorylase